MPEIKYDITTNLGPFVSGINQANAAMDQLTDTTESYSRESTEAFAESAADLHDVSKEIQAGSKNLKTFIKDEEKAGIAGKNAFIEIKKQLKEAKGELAGLDFGDAGYDEAVAKIQELQGKLGDLGDASRIEGTAVERLGQSFGLLQEGILNADPDKLKIGFKGLGEAMAGIPIFLLIQGLMYLIENFDKVVDFVKLATNSFSDEERAVRTLTAQLENQQQVNVKLIGDLDREIALLEAQGASEDKIIEAKKKKIAIQIQEAETTIKLSAAKKLDIQNNNDLYESYLDVVAGLQRKMGFDELAATTEKGLALEKKERMKEEEKNFVEASENLKNLKNELLIIDAEREKKSADKTKEIRKELNDFLADLQKKANQSELEGLTGRAKLDKQKQLDDEEYATFRKALETKGKLLDKNFKFTAEQEAEFAKIKTEINRKYHSEVLKLAEEEALKQAEINKNKAANELQYLEQRNQINKDTIGAMRIADESSAEEKKEFELKKQQVLLQNEISYQNEKLKLVEKEIQAEATLKKVALQAELDGLKDREDAVSLARKQAIQKELDSLSQQQLVAEEVAKASTENIVASLNDKLKDINKQLEPQKIDLNKLLTFDSNEISNILNKAFKGAKFDAKNIDALKEGFKELGSNLKQLAQEYFNAQQQELDAELNAAQKRTEVRNSNLESLQAQLQDELQLQKDGNASNVDEIRRRIAAEEAARQQDLENERKIKEEKAKLQKQQLIIDTISQAANLVTASSTIFATMSGIPIVGIPLAIATIASMISAFSVAKVNAFKAVNAQGFKDGVIDLQGPGTATSDSINARLSRGESVFTAEETKDNIDLFKGIRKRDPKLIEIGVKDLLRNTGVVLSEDWVKEIGSKKSEEKRAEIEAHFHNDNSGMEKRMDGLRQEMKSMHQTVKKRVTVLPDGTTITHNGNNTTIIRKQK